MSNDQRRRRIENALWGYFIADALAMPAHWFYNRENLRRTFDGGITGFADAPHPHPESFMVGMSYEPDVAKADALGRPYDILHEHARYYETTYSKLEIERTEQESEHGNATPAEDERYHYHHGLKAGENTTAAQLVRVLLRSVVAEGRYDEGAFLENFVSYLTTPGRRDPYLEIYLRSWFEFYAAGHPVTACAERQREVWSIGSHGGMLRPMVLSLLATSPYQGLGFALEHQNLTHRSENVAAALGVAVPLLHDLVDGRPALEAAADHASRIRLPKISGEEMFAQYREHDGPGNIPDREMWRLHTELSEEPFDLRVFARQPEEAVVLQRLATACYPEQGLPLALYFAAHHDFSYRAAVLADVNAGGDNVHRSSMLGLIAGAAVVDHLPANLIRGLAEADALAAEIEGFADVALKACPW
ncbi:MAG: ADP-ribosylglycohydrolase family protein [Opitutales bacterium]